MRDAEVMMALVSCRASAAVIIGPTRANAALWAEGHKPPTIYNMDMAYATPMCLGVALARPDLQVIAVEGDGSLLAGCPSLVTIARQRLPHLVVLALDNGGYQSTGASYAGTGTRHSTSLTALAQACGLPSDKVVGVSTPPALETALHAARDQPGPWFIVAHTDGGGYTGKHDGEIGLDIVETAVEFRTAASRPAPPR